MKTYTFTHDLTTEMKPREGQLTFDESGRLTFAGGEFSADEIKETGVIAGVGCGAIFSEMMDGREIILCRFSMSALHSAGEFVKIVNHRILSGVSVIPDEKKILICNRCERPIAEGMDQCFFCFCGRIHGSFRSCSGCRPRRKSPRGRCQSRGCFCLHL